MAITNIGNQLSQQFMLKMLRTQIDEAHRQSTTGKKSVTIADMGASGASQAISLRNQHNLFDNYLSNLNTGKARFQMMDHAFLSITETTREMSSTLRAQLQGGETNTQLLKDKAETLLNNLVEKLNIKHNDRFLFSGDNINNPAFNDRATLDANMSALVAGWMSGTPTAASVAADARAVNGTDLGISMESIHSGDVSMRIDDRTDINYTVRGDNAGFEDILRSLSIIANMPEPTTPAEQENYWAIVNGAIQMMDDGAKAVDHIQGVMGSRAKIVDNMINTHKETQLKYEQFIGDVEDVDMADASLRLQNLTTQLQASMTLIGELRNLSLVNYI